MQRAGYSWETGSSGQAGNVVNRLDQRDSARVGSASFAPAAPPPTPPILFVLNALAIGGSESKTVRLANALADQGSDVTIAYLSSPDLLLSEISPAVRVIYLQRHGKFSFKSLRLLGHGDPGSERARRRLGESVPRPVCRACANVARSQAVSPDHVGEHH